MTEILGWASTIIFSVCIIPQIVKTHKVKKVDELSISMWLMFFFGNVSALLYAILIEEPPLIFKYIFALITSFWLITIYIYYTRKQKGK